MYLVYLLCDGFMVNSVVAVYDQYVVYVSGVVSYVFSIQYIVLSKCFHSVG